MSEDCHESGAAVRHYVVTWRSDVTPGDVEVVGPFESMHAAGAWGEGWQGAHGDNPCWNWVSLMDGHPVVRLAVAPKAPGPALSERVLLFNSLSLPGQPQGMHMGTSYLVNDLWQAHQALVAALRNLVDLLDRNDVDGLTGHADEMVAARAALEAK